MIENFYDIRMFGAVLSTGLNAGQVRGPVQLTFAKSQDPIFRLDCGITRVAVTREQDKQRKETEMARKPVVPYALYRGYGFYNPCLAVKPKKNGEKNNAFMRDNLFVSEQDLEYLWEALWKGFDNDHSAARHIRPRGLYIFTHGTPQGNAPSHRLFDKLKTELKKDLKDQELSPRQFCDYVITLPSGYLRVGSNEVRIIEAEALKKDEPIPDNTAVLTKVYHEEEMG
jgi:CRISPR-associated protein Csd2